MESNPDYATILDTTDPTRFIVAVMRWAGEDEGYRIHWCSSRYRKTVCQEMVKTIATARKVDIR